MKAIEKIKKMSLIHCLEPGNNLIAIRKKANLPHLEDDTYF